MSHFEYIYGFNEVTLHTPHTPLQLLLNGKVKGVSNSRLARWTLDLGSKNLKTVYKSSCMLPRTLLYEGDPHTCDTKPVQPLDSVFEVCAIEGAIDVYVDGSRYWQDGQYHTGFAIHSDNGDFLYRCPSHFSAQKAEISAVLQTFSVFPDSDLNIFSDSAFVVNSLTEYLPIWQKRGFTSADGQPLKQVGPIQALWTAAKSCTHKVALLKVKAHQKKGVSQHGDGNLAVDELAKKAAVAGRPFHVLEPEPELVAVVNVREPTDLKVAQQRDPVLREAIKQKQNGEAILEGPLTLFDAQLLVHDCMLLYTGNDIPVWIPPTELRNDILYHIHNQGGHLGIEKTKDRLKNMFWWPDVDKNVKDYCTNCLTCAQINPSPVKRKGRLRPTCLAEGPWTNLQIDYVGPLPAARGGYRYILIIIDTFTKWIEAFPIKSDTASATARVLWEQVYCRWGLPLSLESDRGTHFTGKIHTDLAKLLGIKHQLHIAHHPQSSGGVERTNRTLKTALRKMVLENGTNWAQNLPSILMSVRGVVHKSTGYSPHELMTGRGMRMPEHLLLEVPRPMIEGWATETFLKNLCSSLPAMYQQAAQQIGSIQKYNKMYYDQHVSEQKFEPGDEVMVKNYHHAGPWSANWKGPYTVIDKCGNVYSLSLFHCYDHPVLSGQMSIFFFLHPFCFFLF
ncbi:protein NYNRIN-like [Anguilla anguilla]|uniref:protein NYNRIN-like n=1 Tax=Anguilla anguilla TaxID=7936 RepID=UPI0015B2170D|nr:protein NYNRIN-like [Anguilla anguilla]